MSRKNDITTILQLSREYERRTLNRMSARKLRNLRGKILAREEERKKKLDSLRFCQFARALRKKEQQARGKAA